MKLHYQTLVLDNAKAAKPKARPAVFTYRPLKVKTNLKAGYHVGKLV